MLVYKLPIPNVSVIANSAINIQSKFSIKRRLEISKRAAVVVSNPATLAHYLPSHDSATQPVMGATPKSIVNTSIINST